jgi:transposase-like protein
MLDEVFCKINGRQVYLWRAVDPEGEVLDILLQQPRNAKAAKRFFRQLLKGLKYVPRAIVTDKVQSYVCRPARPRRILAISLCRLEELAHDGFYERR